MHTGTIGENGAGLPTGPQRAGGVIESVRMNGILKYCAGLTESTFGCGELLMAEGGRNGVLYILIDGEVEVLKGDFQITTVSEPGALFGEISVLLDIPHTATVRTLRETRVFLVEDAVSFLQSHADIAFVLARLLAQRLNGVTSYLVDLKRQFGSADDHLGIVDEVLESLVHQQAEECIPGSERDPDIMI